jgi:hypothetical protein
MRAVIEDGDLQLPANGNQLGERLGEEEETFPEDDHLRAQPLDHLDRRGGIHPVAVRRERQEVEVHRVVAPGDKTLAAHLDAAAEDADQVVADVASGVG